MMPISDAYVVACAAKCIASRWRGTRSQRSRCSVCMGEKMHLGHPLGKDPWLDAVRLWPIGEVFEDRKPGVHGGTHDS